MLGKRPSKKLDADGLWSYSLKLLGGRARSTGEVRQKLKNRAETEADIELTIAKLRDYGYLNDTLFAENYASWRPTTKDSGRCGSSVIFANGGRAKRRRGCRKASV